MCNTAEVLGDDSGVTGALLRRNDGSERKIDIAGFFLAIGHHPNTELFAEQLALDAEGYIKVEPGTSKTSVEGVFAAGDVKESIGNKRSGQSRTPSLLFSQSCAFSSSDKKDAAPPGRCGGLTPGTLFFRKEEKQLNNLTRQTC